MMEAILSIKELISIVVVAMLIVLFAMMIDLASGLYKAKLRGELHTSDGLRRTLMKFITYEGGMMIAAGVDALITLSRFESLFHLDLLYQIPVITILVGIFLLIVEMISVKEKADEKTKKNLSDAAMAAIKLAQREELTDLISRLYEASQRDKQQQHGHEHYCDENEQLYNDTEL